MLILWKYRGETMISSIAELDRWCVMNNRIIVVKRGKLCGFFATYDR